MAIQSASQKLVLMTKFPEAVFYVRDFSILSNIAAVAGRSTSLWLAGGNPGAGAAPGAVAAPTSATAGAVPFTNATGGRSKYLVQIAGTCGSPGVIVFYDRLLHISGLSGTSTGVQTVGGTITRYTGGDGNWIAVEIYTTIGATSRNLTVNYTNQTGAAKSVTVALGNVGLDEIGRFVVCPLASGDTGVQSVTSVQLDGSTGTAGNFGVTVGHTLGVLPISSVGGASERNFVGDGDAGTLVQPSACIAAYFTAEAAVTTGNAAMVADYGLHMVEA